MRVTEKIVTQGNFWLPSEPDNKISGTLTISDGGEIELEVTDVFGKIPLKKLNDAVDISRIQGKTERGPVTLEKCFYIQKKFSLSGNGINKSRIYVNMAMFNAVDETATFNTFSFSVEGLEKWLRLPAITVDYDKKSWPPRSIFIRYSKPEDILLFSTDKMNARLTVEGTLPIVDCFAEATIKLHACIRLESEEKKPLFDFIDTATMLNAFFCFAMDKTVCIKNVFARSTEYTESMKSTEIFYQSRIFSPETHRSPLMLFLYPTIKDKYNFSAMLTKWREMYESTIPALHLYFERADICTSLDVKFLVLAQVLEIYYRKTYKKDAPLKTMILKLLALIKNRYAIEIKGSAEDIATDIAGIRNYLTHYDNDFKAKAQDTQLLDCLCLKMELMFQLHLLQGIGFTDTDIKQVVEQSWLKQKLDCEPKPATGD